MKKIIVGMLGFITQLFSFGHTQTVVYVQDANNQPLAKVVVLVQSPSAMTGKSLTDKQGRVVVKKILGSSMIRLSRDGFKTKYIAYPEEWPLYVTLRRQ